MLNDIEFESKIKEIINALIGKEVKNKGLGFGTVIEVDEHVSVDFDGDVKDLTLDKFFDYNVPTDELILSELISVIKDHEEYLEYKDKEGNILPEQKSTETNKEKEINKRALKNTKSSKAFDDKFGSDYNLNLLKKSTVLTYKDVEKLHEINIHGFGRGINVKDDCVVLISTIKGNSDRFTYHDKWNYDGNYEYSGEGSVGDQTMSRGNKAIVEASLNGKNIYLYVKFSPKEYYQQGIMKLIEYKKIQAPDKNGKMRKEYVFILARV